jgi:dienelactone hydrolase
MGSRSIVIGVVVWVASALTTGIAHASDGLFTLTLPAPGGPHPVGTTQLHLVDHRRRDPWGSGAERELMITVFYPASDVRGYPLAPKMRPGAAAEFEKTDTRLHSELPQGKVDWSATLTDAHTGAPAEAGRHPVLLYSPGLGDPRTIGTEVAEDLASRGYFVVTIDHPGETSEVEFPDGRVQPMTMPLDPALAGKTIETALAARLADTKFVLDELDALAAGRNPDAEHRSLPRNLTRSLDVTRIGMYGHSAGGSTAAEAMYEDSRIGAAVDLDGNLDFYSADPARPAPLFPVAANGVDRPLLLLGSREGRDADIDRSWTALLTHQDGRTRWLQVNDAAHHVFTDFAAEAPELQAAGLMSQADRDSLVGAIDPAESVPAVRDYVAAFFDQQLRHGGGHLLDGPNPRYPDVVFVR